MTKKTRVRIKQGSRLDGVRVSKTIVVTKSWTEVSPTLAKSLVGLEYQGRPKFEFEDDVADNAAPETSEEAATEDE